MHASTKGASVEDHVRHLRRYKGEFVRDLAYSHVRLPAAWLAPGDATIFALDEPGPAGRRPERPVQGAARPVRTPDRRDRVC